jgi:serine/threonine-protein kinase
MRCAGGSAKALAAGVSVALAFSSTLAGGQTQSHGDKVAAEALFEEGRKLVAAGKYADACAKFVGSEQLDPSAATLLNLASCWEKSGRAATAWATYREAASLANAVGRADYLATAQRHADALAPRLSHLTLNVAQPVNGIEIRRDDVVLPAAEWGTAIPIDSGPHSLAASSPEHESWASTIEVPGDGATVVVTVPSLEPVAQAPAPAPAPRPDVSAPTMGPSPAPAPTIRESASPRSTGGAQRVAGWVLGSAGLASVAAGVVFTVLAENSYHDSLNNCVSKDSCDPTGLSERNQARTYGDVASWTIGLGAAAIVGGLVLVITSPRGDGNVVGANGARVALAPTPGGAVLTGSW